MINAIQPAAEIVNEIYTDFLKTLRELSNL
jgi:hypothetical protein